MSEQRGGESPDHLLERLERDLSAADLDRLAPDPAKARSLSDELTGSENERLLALLRDGHHGAAFRLAYRASGRSFYATWKGTRELAQRAGVAAAHEWSREDSAWRSFVSEQTRRDWLRRAASLGLAVAVAVVARVLGADALTVISLAVLVLALSLAPFSRSGSEAATGLVLLGIVLGLVAGGIATERPHLLRLAVLATFLLSLGCAFLAAGSRSPATRSRGEPDGALLRRRWAQRVALLGLVIYLAVPHGCLFLLLGGGESSGFDAVMRFYLFAGLYGFLAGGLALVASIRLGSALDFLLSPILIVLADATFRSMAPFDSLLLLALVQLVTSLLVVLLAACRSAFGNVEHRVALMVVAITAVALVLPALLLWGAASLIAGEAVRRGALELSPRGLVPFAVVLALTVWETARSPRPSHREQASA